MILAAACALAGCGGGGSGKKANTSTVQRVYRAPTTGQTTPHDTTASPVTPTQPSSGTTPATPPPANAAPGGSEPARTELTFTASKAGVKPREASVAPFVAVRISLVSADRSSHKLVIGGHTLKVGGTRKSMFVELPGLRAGKTYTGKADGHISIRIISSNEPGP